MTAKMLMPQDTYVVKEIHRDHHLSVAVLRCPGSIPRNFKGESCESGEGDGISNVSRVSETEERIYVMTKKR